MRRIKIDVVLQVTWFACLIAALVGELNASNSLKSDRIFINERSRDKLHALTKDQNTRATSVAGTTYANCNDAAGHKCDINYRNAEKNEKEHCTKGTSSKDDCDSQNMKCRKRSSGKGYECKGCLDGFHDNVTHCLEPCSVGTKWYRTCEKEKRNCDRLAKSPYARCSDCKDGYFPRKIFFSEECFELCSPGSPSEQKCKNLKRKCQKTKTKPFYQCRCADNLTEENGICVEYCQSGTETENSCSKENRECISLANEPYFKCGKCKANFQEAEKQCVEYCTNGTSSEKKCSAQNKICDTVTKEPFFNCTKCFDGYVLKEGKCIKYCDIDSPGYTECFSSNRECHFIKQHPFYECQDCLQNYTKIGEKCVVLNIVTLPRSTHPGPVDCAQILKGGITKSGIYRIWPLNWQWIGSFEVYCDMETDGGGWTVIQRRGDFGNPVDYFYKTWKEYRMGFGSLDKDFWLGNDKIFAVSNQGNYSLRINMEDKEGEKRYAFYREFWIESERQLYQLHNGVYTGDAGDSFSGANGFKFSTKDEDNDASEGNCAKSSKGGWWYGNCHLSNLNGLYHNGYHKSYADGVNWHSWRGFNYSLPIVEMKIRPITY